MRHSIIARFFLALFTSLFVFCLSSSAFGAATIVIQNKDVGTSGFNDLTPVPAVGGNPGLTLGQQRLNAFQYAANIWGAILNSNATITIDASWGSLTPCDAGKGVLAQAGAVSASSDFPNAPFPATWYSAALANSLAGSDRSGASEIRAKFNLDVGTANCLPNSPFYLGLDNKHGSGTDLVSVLLHEFSHGFGFQTLTDGFTGAEFSAGASGPLPTIYDRFLVNDATSKTWIQMTDAERQTSAINTGNLTWNGTHVTTDAQNMFATPRLRVNSPPGVAGNYTAGAATFGAPLNSSGVTANVALSAPADGCSAFTNVPTISGRIALIDRGNCTFITKVKNAQNAGAVGVVVANNPANDPLPFGQVVITMSGGDSTITIPSVFVSLSDGNIIKGQLGSGVNATLLADFSVPSGVNSAGRPRMYAPAMFELGSSVSHWDTTLYPNQLMEPNDNGDLTHSVAPNLDLTTSLLRDIGWGANYIGDTHFFVRQQYLDFLGREPDRAGLNFWANDIASCGLDQGCGAAKHVNVSAAFFLSIEFQETGYLVYRFYRAAYGEKLDGSAMINNVPTQIPVPIIRRQEFIPDTQAIGQGVQVGIGNWQLQLENNKQAYAQAFVRTARFTTQYPTTLSPTSFVDQLFATAGVAAPSPADRQSAIAEFNGASNTIDLDARGRAMRKIAENSILAQQEKNKAFVLMQYFGYLRRNPNDTPDNDHSGYKFWLDKLNLFNGDYAQAQMVQAFLDSFEYRDRFGT